ncbi:MAG: hypothetical protein ACE5NA_06295 [Nitrospiraceae bacterium]
MRFINWPRLYSRQRSPLSSDHHRNARRFYAEVGKPGSGVAIDRLIE